MHVLILGTGVVGVTAAWYLARAGHQVTVLDRQPGPALETSHANAGEISSGYAAPWAAPGVPGKVPGWLFMRHAPLILHLRPDPALVRWLAAFLGECRLERFLINKSRMLRLAEYSRDQLRGLRNETGIRYDEASLGTLQVFRTARQLEAGTRDAALLAEHGIAHQLLERDQLSRYEPALAAVKEKFTGGLRLPGDETGDCLKFTRQLADQAAGLGVRFLYGTSILGLERQGRCIVGVRTQAGTQRADAYLVALASRSPALVAPLGLDLPVYPVKGYSLTVPVVDPQASPLSTVMDETHKVAITRLGDRIRLGGLAELNGFNLDLPPARLATLAHVLADLFPGGGDAQRAIPWTGLRPMTPDGTPILGPTPYSNLYLATGHGTLGWTMAAGTGRVLADLISGRRAEIDLEGLTLARYGQGQSGNTSKKFLGPPPIPSTRTPAG